MWIDPALFLLYGVEAARHMLNVQDTQLTMGEIWALMDMQVNLKNPDGPSRHLNTARHDAITRNLDRMEAVIRNDGMH